MVGSTESRRAFRRCASRSPCRTVTPRCGNQLAAAITLTAFLALFALDLIAVAVVGFVSAGSADVPSRVVDNLGLSGDAATTVTDAIHKAEQSRRLHP